MPQLEFASYPAQFFWLLVFWSLSYIVVAWVFIPGMHRIFKQRSEATKHKLESAAATMLQCNKLRAEIVSALEMARSKALAAKSSAKLQAKVIVAEQAAETEYELEKKIGKEMEKIRRLEQRVRNDLPDVSNRLSSEIIGTLLGNIGSTN